MLTTPLAVKAGEVEDALIAAVALACVEDAGDAAAMAAALRYPAAPPRSPTSR